MRKEAWRQNAQECTEILTNKATHYIIGSGRKAVCIICGRRNPLSAVIRNVVALLVAPPECSAL